MDQFKVRQALGVLGIARGSLVDLKRGELIAEQTKRLRELVEEIRIDFDRILLTVGLLEDNGVLVKEEVYQDAFYALWLEGLPESIKQDFVFGLENNDRIILEIKNYVIGMGSKLKAVKSGLCVSPVIEPKCEKCYFLEVCPAPIK